MNKMNEPTDKAFPLIWTAQKTLARESRNVANECAFAFEYNCVSHAVMMVTPENLDDYIYGFSLTEGIISGAEDILGTEIITAEKGMIGAIEISPKAFENLNNFRRVLTGRTGCGLCGSDRLEHAIRHLKELVSDIKISAKNIHGAMEKLWEKQKLNHLTGAMHAAAFANKNGDIIGVREDIGRHNALDKLIGYMMKENIDPSSGCALITSRCSFEMVHKCAAFGIPIVAAVSAPTGLAIQLAEETGVSLAAFVRKEGLNIYADPQERITL